jgi:nitric oxide dioxygenase
MSNSLTETTKAIVKATVPALQAHGTAITAAMYERLFQDEEVRELFNHSNQGEGGRQTKALAHAILAYAQNIDNIGVLASAVERISQKHVGLSIKPEHYPYVATALLGAISDVLGEAATQPILDAWGEAFWFLANILIGREKAVYDDLEAAPGGWIGWREFRVERKIPESDIITSFVLRPIDGGKIVMHKPGQYLTFRIPIEGLGPQKRNYSISSAPNSETYRISVKREPGGLISNYLHDNVQEGSILQVAPPTGDFFLQEGSGRPVVLLSGGVGLTPMVSIFETLVASDAVTEIHYVHAAQNGRVHAMGGHIRNLQQEKPHVSTAFFYREPHEHDLQGEHYDHKGHITVDWLSGNTPIDEADFYLCGPKPFLAAFVNGLARAGVSSDRIHYEFFGPADGLDE